MSGEKVIMIWLLSTLGISALEFVVWFLFLWFVLKQRNINRNIQKSTLICIPAKLGLAYYIWKFGKEDWERFKDLVSNLRVRFDLLHYFLCVVEILFGLVLGLLSWVVTPFLLIGGGLVVLFIKYIIGSVMEFYEKNKIQILSFWESWKNGMIELERVFRYPKIF